MEDNMGYYNSAYESYYKNLANKKKSTNNASPLFSAKRIYRRFLQELIGTLILFTFVITCKIFTNSYTKAAYNYSKSLINQNLDYKAIISKVENIKFKDLGNNFETWFNDVKMKLDGENDIKDKTKSSFILPVSGKILSPYGSRTNSVTKAKEFHYGIDISVSANTDIKAAYDGKVKSCGENSSSGKYIILAHDDGIETKYCFLNSINVKQGDAVKKSQVIGKSGNTGESMAPHLHFEILYMGQNCNPEEYLNFAQAIK